MYSGIEAHVSSLALAKEEGSEHRAQGNID